MNTNLSNSCAFQEKQEVKKFDDTTIPVAAEEVFSNSSSSPDLEIDWDLPPIFDDYSDSGHLIQNITTQQPISLEKVELDQLGFDFNGVSFEYIKLSIIDDFKIYPIKPFSKYEDPFLRSTFDEHVEEEIKTLGFLNRIWKVNCNKMMFKQGQRLQSCKVKDIYPPGALFIWLYTKASLSLAHNGAKLKWHHSTSQKPKFKQKRRQPTRGRVSRNHGRLMQPVFINNFSPHICFRLLSHISN